MTMTSDRRELYTAMTHNEREAIDEAYDRVEQTLKNYSIETIGDDRAENLVGAIARFVEDSKGGNRFKKGENSS